VEEELVNWWNVAASGAVSLFVAVIVGVIIRFHLKSEHEKVFEQNRNKTIPRLLNQVYQVDSYVGRAVQILTSQKNFDRVEQKSYEVTKLEASRLEYFLKQIREIDKSIQDNDKFLTQYLEFEEYSTIATFIHNSANFFLFPEDETGKVREGVFVFCLPQYMHARIDYARKLLEMFSVRLKPEFVKEWNDFLSNYESPY